MKKLIILIVLTCLSMTVTAQRVTITAREMPAAGVFRKIMEQTGKNFVYSSDLLKNMKVTVNARNTPLKDVLNEIFSTTDIEYKIKGTNVILKRKEKKRKQKLKTVVSKGTPKLNSSQATDKIVMLDEIEVVSRLESPQVETSEIGARKVTGDQVRATPVLFGEADVIKALTMEPGVTEGSEGMAGMNVHGGNADENLYLLDNVPLYQVNHFAGLFSAFNTDIIRYIDFFKTSMPAKYDGRLSSFLDVRTLNSTSEGHHGSARIGLTSGAFNIAGPIGKKTRYLFGLRRSWFDVLTVPALAIINSTQDDTSNIFNYFFTDLNAKVSHKFSDKATGVVSVYFGDDRLRIGYKDDYGDYYSNTGMGTYDYKKTSEISETNTLHWGNLVAQLGLNYRLNTKLTAEFTAAYTRYFSDLSHTYKEVNYTDSITLKNKDRINTENNINDWIFRGDFYWQPADRHRVRFGANYVRHSFIPQRTTRRGNEENFNWEFRDSTWRYGANEANIYIEDDWNASDKIRLNAGIHASLFHIDNSLKHGISPRISIAYRPIKTLALKSAYSRTTQYVHQLTESYLSLPTDQWIPVTGKFKPQTADKIAAGAYWQTNDGGYAVSIEGYYKWMHNLMDYRDEYYLRPPVDIWNARLTSGKGTAKGLDLKVEKKTGKITGHIAYSLGWADRTFAEKNDGITYPARFDHRHTINILVNWNISSKVQLNAAWTGHSGNRFTLLSQSWEMPDFGIREYRLEAPLKMPLNYYQLPFYHRLDLACVVRNKRGYWTFSLYNAYNHMNVISIARGSEMETMNYIDKYGNSSTTWVSIPVLRKQSLLPILPSVSYTWEF